MTRKKKPPPQPKRLQLTDSDGWTHIIKGLKSTYLNDKTKSKIRDKIRPADIPDGQTLHDLQKSHSYYLSQWQSSTCCQNVQKLFLNDILPSIPPKAIERCVVLGIGSFSEDRRSCWWELVFLETILELLQNMVPPNPKSRTASHETEEKEEQMEQGAEAKIKVFLQDPVFNTLDTAFLESLGYVVLKTPAAFDEINKSTFVFAPHVEVDVYSEALKGINGLPTLCIGTDLNFCFQP
ncbi:MAG: hypothetical protein Q9222_000061 [Ikaeria aurantiellina]